MTTLTDTAADIYAAILLQPEDDTLRLAFADALEDAGDHARAEFIRVQVELARMEQALHRVCKINQDCASGDCAYCRRDYLKARESAILAQHGDGWRRGEKCPECKGDGRGSTYNLTGVPCRNPGGCSKCRGTGYTSPLAAKEWVDNVSSPNLGVYLPDEFIQGNYWWRWRYDPQFSRGLIASYSARHAEVFTDDGPSEWACDVARAFPVQEIRLTTHPAWEDAGGQWTIGGNGMDRPFLHHGIVDKAVDLALEDGLVKNTRLFRLKTQALAEHYQARAVAEIIRKSAFKEKR